jgi:adenosine kinase
MDNNQITAFHPGAMMQAHITAIAPRRDIKLASSRPTGAMPCCSTPAVQGRRHPVRVRSGPGPADVRRQGAQRFVDQASWVTVNDYEGKMLCERTGLDSPSHLTARQRPGRDAGR